MVLSQKTLECLREMINERTEYRSGPKIIQFFNALGFTDSYGQGFPSRWIFTDDRLAKINGTPRIGECIKRTFAPINFIGRVGELDQLLSEFNQYLAFDKWRVERKGAELEFRKLERVEVQEPPSPKQKEDDFLQRDFSDVRFDGLGLEPTVLVVLDQRVKEIEKCYSSASPLAVILLAGSTLEGVLLGMATCHPRAFNSASAAPKDAAGKVRPFQAWTLNNFIEVSRELHLIEHDTYKFSHVLRDFRNYIHPFEQLASGFSPREHTAKICLQVLRAASHDLRQNVAELRA
jgi:hypothetical protein